MDEKRFGHGTPSRLPKQERQVSVGDLSSFPNALVFCQTYRGFAGAQRKWVEITKCHTLETLLRYRISSFQCRNSTLDMRGELLFIGLGSESLHMCP